MTLSVKRKAGDPEDGFAANPEGPLKQQEELRFLFGEEQVPAFVETCVKEMKNGGVSEFLLAPSSHPEYEPGQELHLLIHLNYEAAPTAWSLSPAQLFEEAANRKAQGMLNRPPINIRK